MITLVVYAICAEMGIDPYTVMRSIQHDEFTRRADTVWRMLGLL
jgi:hypothetical protein